MNKNLLFLILHPFRLCIFWISSLARRSNSKWVFSCWMGVGFTDNVKAFFVYVNKKQPDIRAIWITRSKPLVVSLRDSGFEAYYYLSFRGIYHQVSSGVAIVSQLFEWDFEPSFSSKKQIKVQLWHGIPMKKICRDDDRFGHSRARDLIKMFFFPYLCHNYKLIVASAEYDQNIYPSAFGVDSMAVRVTGLPRYDEMKTTLCTRNAVFRFCYAPTFRGKINSFFTLFGSDLDILNGLNSFCVENNFEFYIKLHPVQRLNEFQMEFIQKSSNIFFASPDSDAASVLANSDCLITDFSSVYFDAIYMRKPVLMAPFDFEQYISSDRSLYMSYSNYCILDPSFDWRELFGSMVKISSLDPNSLRILDEKRSMFFRYDDGESCSRIYSSIVDVTELC